MENSKKKTSKYRGVYWDAWANKWMALYSVNGKKKRAGLYETEAEANNAYLEATAFRRENILPVVNLDGEQWIGVVGAEGEYMVSDMGRVKSLNYNRTGLESLLKLNASDRGYMRFYFHGATVMVHRKMWEAFNGPIPDGFQINHEDLNPSNNKLNNLELVTPRENVHHYHLSNGTPHIGCMKTKWGRWKVQIYIDGRKRWGGVYDTVEEAQRAYCKQMEKYGESSKYT